MTTDEVLAEVGPRLRRIRKERGATLAGLSEATGISVSTLSRLESGLRKPSLELLLPIAQAHQVPLDELVGAPAVQHGGGQERERRSGTQNVAGIVGMATALDVTVAEREATVQRVGGLRDHLVDQLLRAIPGAFETVPRELKVAGNAHVCVPGVESEALLVLLDDGGVCASAGSSCASGAMEPSHVLTAMGLPSRAISGGLRMTLGRTTTDYEVDLALKVIPDAVAHLRETA